MSGLHWLSFATTTTSIRQQSPFFVARGLEPLTRVDLAIEQHHEEEALTSKGRNEQDGNASFLGRGE